MTDQNHAITKAPSGQLTHQVKDSVTIDGQRYQVQIIQQPDSRPTHYQTAKSRGLPPQPVRLPKLPAVLPLTLSAIIAVCFLVGASMFSISLTAYSNSVDRVDRDRSFMRVE